MNRLVFLLLCASAVAEVQAGYTLENPKVSAHEPIILSFWISNNSTEVVKADLGLNRKQAFLLSGTRPDGKPLNARPALGAGLDFEGRIAIEPGKRFTQKLVLNEWFDFAQLGSYELRVSLSNPIRTEGGQALIATDEFVARVEVGPSNAQELSLACEKLAREAAETDDYDSAVQAATALSVIDDPSVVPYLARLLDASAPIQTVVISALERFANFEAVNALTTALESRSKATASLARVALERIAITSPDPQLRTRARESLNRQ